MRASPLLHFITHPLCHGVSRLERKASTVSGKSKTQNRDNAIAMSNPPTTNPTLVNTPDANNRLENVPAIRPIKT
jgi:hypothetical protein